MGDTPTVTTVPSVIGNTEGIRIGEAASLIRAIGGLGTVARLDFVHDALAEAYRRGREQALRSMS